MGIMTQNCEEIQNLPLQFLGGKTTGTRWISSLIHKFWNTAWYVWNYINHTLHSPGSTTKTDILRLINKRTTYHLNRSISGLTIHLHLLLHTSIHILLFTPSPSTSFMASCHTQCENTPPMINNQERNTGC